MTKLSLFATIAAVASLASSLFAQGGGKLTPPGPPEPTMKTLQEIEPRIPLIGGADSTSAVKTSDPDYHFIIAEPGSYYLTENIGVTKANGIAIQAAGVTLDLNGFEIRRGSGSGGNGIELDPASDRCTVENGTITGFAYGLRGIFGLVGNASRFARAASISRLTVGAGSSHAIRGGEAWRFTDCSVHDNGGTGIIAGNWAVVARCVATANGGGIVVGDGAILTESTCSKNLGPGILTGSGSTITDCSAYENGSFGIFTGVQDTGSTITNCTAYLNGNNGISGGTVTVAHCTAYENGSGGIVGGPGSTISSSSAGKNATVGISAISGSTIVDSTAYLNGTDGIFAATGVSVLRCTASSNSRDGIQANFRTLIRDNTCHNNGNGAAADGAGIHATGSDNRIEGNQVTNNDRGIDVDGPGNVILKNTAANNTSNYEIAGSNRYGAIVNITASGGAAVSGSGGVASNLTSADPWANFSY